VTFPPIGVTAVIAGMSIFNRDAAIVESRLLRINAVSNQLERETGGAFVGALGAFGSMATQIATGATVIAGGLALAGGAAIKFAADFQQGLALTGALTGATAGQLEQLTGVITDLSRHGTLGMEDLASAATDLARSGVPIEAVMGGALKAVQDLAIASGGELGLENAAKLTATAMQAFGISVEDVNKVTTAATVVAQNSALTFTDFKTAVATAGAPFASVGFTIEDLATAEALLGRNALGGSQSATALRNIIQRLEKPSKDAAAVMKQYGIHLFDASGNAVGLRDLLGQLNTSFGDQAIAEGKLTEQQRDQALATLFLQRAGAAALILTREGTKGYDELRASFDRLNASEIVDALLKPLNAQVKIAANNVVALGIAFGTQFLPPLQEATAGLVAFLQKIPTDQAVNFGRNVVEGIGAVGGAVQAAIGGIQSFLAAFGLTDAAGQFLKSTLVGLALTVATILGSAIAGTVAAWGGFLLAVGAAMTIASKIDGVIKNLGYTFANWISQFGPLGLGIGNLVRSASDGFGTLSALFRGDFDTALSQANQSFYGFAATLRTNGGEALQFVQDRLADAGQAFAPWAAQAGSAGTAVGQALSGASAAVQSLQFLLQGNLPAAGQAAQVALGSFGDAISTVATAINDTFKAAIDWVTTTGWPSVQAGAQTAADVLNSTVVSAIESVANKITTALQPAIDGIRDAWPGITKGAEDFGTALAGVDWGATAAAAKDFATQVAAATAAIEEKLGIFQALNDAIEPIRDALATLGPVLKQVGEGLAALGPPAKAVADAFVALQGPSVVIGIAISALLYPFKLMADTIHVAAIAFDVLAHATSAYVTALGNYVSNIGNSVNTAKGFFESLASGIEAALTAVITFVGGFFSTLGSSVQHGLSNIHEFFLSVWNAIPADIQADLTLVLTLLGQRMGEWLAAVINFGAQILSATQNAWNGITSAIGTALEGALTTVATILGNLINTFGANYSDLGTRTHSAFDEILSTITTILGQVVSAVQAWAGDVVKAISGLAAEVGTAAASIGSAIINGIIGGINAGVQAVKDAAGNMARAALSAAKTALGAQSPSKLFAELGGDAGDGLIEGMDASQPDVSAAGSDAGMALAQGMIDALDAMKAPVRGSAAALVDQAINALSDIGNRAGQLMADTESKMAAVGETAGRKINEAIKAAADQIEQTIADAQSRIDDLQASLGQSRADRGARDDLRARQDARRAARRAGQEDEDAAAAHTKDLADADFKRTQDIAKAKAKAEHDLTQATTDKQRAAIAARLEDELAAADVSYKQELDRINRAFAASEKDRADRRQRQQDDADFEAKLAQETQELNDKLENEALQRSIDRTIQERDARIDSINKALTAKETKIKEEAAREVENLRDNVERRLRILEDEFAKKAADLLRKGGENMRPLVENIQQILSGNFDAMRQSALDFANSVGQAINALKELEAARRRAEFSAPNLPDPTKGLDGVPDVPDQFENVPLPEFGRGGVVQGPLGQPQLAIVHGGEFVASLDSAAARIARMMQGPAAPSGTSIYNYNVNASYADTQSPASVEMDMRALILMARG
jgi:TP901 family phage tail tape measure protein